jgi:hypothetical protein
MSVQAMLSVPCLNVIGGVCPGLNLKGCAHSFFNS